MQTRRTRRIVVATAGSLLLAMAAPAQLPGDAAHWKATIEMEGGPAQAVGPLDSEIWLKQGKVRMQMHVMGMTQNFVKSGDTTYQWVDGQKMGMKTSTRLFERQAAAGDYATRIDEYRRNGKKVGSEKIEGHPCDIYELATKGEPGGDRKETVWLATDLHNFPVKVVVEASGTKMTSLNREISFGAPIPDAMLTPPSDVSFRDMADMMRQMEPPKQ